MHSQWSQTQKLQARRQHLRYTSGHTYLSALKYHACSACSIAETLYRRFAMLESRVHDRWRSKWVSILTSAYSKKVSPLSSISSMLSSSSDCQQDIFENFITTNELSDIPTKELELEYYFFSSSLWFGKEMVRLKNRALSPGLKVSDPKPIPFRKKDSAPFFSQEKSNLKRFSKK